MGLGWFDAIAGAAMPLYSGIQSGNLMAEELQRKRQEEALRKQLLEAQIGSYNDRASKWEPTTMEEARDYELAIHPERTDRPDATVQPEWEKAGFPDQESYLEYLGKKSRTEFPERFTQPPRTADVTQGNRRNQGLAYLEQYKPGQPATPELVAQSGAFHEAFRAIRSGNPELDPGTVSYQALEAARRTQPELWQKGGSDEPGDFEREYLEAMRSGGAAPMGSTAPGGVPPVDPVAPIAPAAPPQGAPPPPAPGNPTGKRAVTQDQADYLRAIGRWDDAQYEVR